VDGITVSVMGPDQNPSRYVRPELDLVFFRVGPVPVLLVGELKVNEPVKFSARASPP
jgi:hypothetical protein